MPLDGSGRGRRGGADVRCRCELSFAVLAVALPVIGFVLGLGLGRTPSPTSRTSPSPVAPVVQYQGAAAQSTSSVAATSLIPIAQSGPHFATLLVDPYPPTTIQETKLMLNVVDENGAAVEGAKVSFDLTLRHPMPPNNALTVEEANGDYLASAVLTMAGLWDIHADVSAPPAGASSFSEYRRNDREGLSAGQILLATRVAASLVKYQGVQG